MLKQEKVGLVPMSAKPYHWGHDELVRLAAKENDIVFLFISTTSRERPGEMIVSGEAMQTIWWDYIEPTLPDNVIVDYGGVPVSKVYEALEKAEDSKSNNVYSIYSDDEDILKYTDENLEKSAPTLFANDQIKLRGVKRTETIDVSGTEMRGYIEDDDVESFTALLPPAVQKYGKEIFDLLSDDIKESLLKKYVSLILESL